MTLMNLSHPLLDRGDGLSWVKVLRANLRAVHNCVAPVKLEGVIELLKALLGEPISTIFNPSVGLHQHCRAKVLIGIPPVARTTRAAALT